MLAPYLPDVVIIGGWVPELHRLYGGATWRTVPSRTTELDVLVGSVLDPRGRPKLRELLEDAQIRPARPGTFPADWVSPATDATVIEFLMARPGPAITDSPRQVDLQGYLGAILIDDAEVLASFTCELVVRAGEEQWTVRVPTLGAWAISKALTFGARRAPVDPAPGADKRAKDRRAHGREALGSTRACGGERRRATRGTGWQSVRSRTGGDPRRHERTQ